MGDGKPAWFDSSLYTSRKETVRRDAERILHACAQPACQQSQLHLFGKSLPCGEQNFSSARRMQDLPRLLRAAACDMLAQSFPHECGQCSLPPPTTRQDCAVPAVGLARPGHRVAGLNLDCSERYAALVSCGAREYLFTRSMPSRIEPAYPGRKGRYETRVRVRARTDSATTADGMNWQPFSPPSVTFEGAGGDVSDNAVVHCHKGALVAYGGLGVGNSFSEARGNANRGIWRMVAAATAPPLRWGARDVVISSSKEATGCIEARGAPSCVFDGKLSVVALRGRVLLFSRSNLARDGGARHVQVAVGTVVGGDRPPHFGKFQQLVFEGLRQSAEAPVRATNLYYFVARPATGTNGTRLFGWFPATVAAADERNSTMSSRGTAGIFGSTSADGVHWTAPVHILASRNSGDGRTADHPVDADLGPAERRAQLRLLVQHEVDLRAVDVVVDRAHCRLRPYVCAYPVRRRAFGGGGDSATERKTKLLRLGSMLRIRRHNGTETDASQRREGRIVAGKQNASQEKRTSGGWIGV